MAENTMKYDSGRFNDDLWGEHFEALKGYLQIHNKYPCHRNSKLKSWVYKQKQRGKMGRLTSRRISLLNSIDFDWGCSRTSIKAVDASGSDQLNNSSRQHLETTGAAAGVSVARSSSVDSIAIESSGSQKTSRDPSKEMFKIRIPAYYKDIYPESALEQAVTDANAEDLPNLPADMNEKNIENVSSGNNEYYSSNGVSDTISSTKEKRAAQHKQFISVLERYGSNQGSKDGTLAWHAMAAELKWPIEDVKVYAYSYFKFLVEGELDHSKQTQLSKKDKVEAIVTNSSWTCDELVLLDSLVLKYCSANDLKKKYEDGSFAWKKVAASLPGKTPQDCHQMCVSRV